MTVSNTSGFCFLGENVVGKDFAASSDCEPAIEEGLVVEEYKPQARQVAILDRAMVGQFIYYTERSKVCM